eukprot:34602-Pleurochrysis_carterae.AAC.1
MTVVLVRRLPFTASEVSVMQCMPAPVPPSHMAFAHPLRPLLAVPAVLMSKWPASLPVRAGARSGR